MTKQVVLKPLDKQLSEHKDIIKVVVQLSSIISSLKADAIDVLENFSSFSNLWTQVGLDLITFCIVFVTNTGLIPTRKINSGAKGSIYPEAF